MEQIGVAIVFKAFFVSSKLGKTGLTVTVDVYSPAGSLLVTAGSATEVGGGLYTYTLASGSVTTEGEYVAIFKTTDTTVDQRHIPSLWIVGRGGIEDLDAAISSRMATFTYTAPDNASLTTLTGRLTSTRAGLLDNLDAAVSTRLASAGYTAPDNADIATLVARLTNTRAGLLDNLASLDAAISSRMATFSYTAPDNTNIGEILADTAALVTDLATLMDRITALRAGYLDNLTRLDAAISTRATPDDFAAAADPLENAVPGDYPVGSAGYLLGQLSAGDITVVAPVSADGATISLVQGDTYDEDEERALVWSSADWPDLTGADVELRVTSGVRTLNYACTVVDAMTVSLELTAEQTAVLAGRYHYRLVAALAGDEHVQTLVEGTLLVERAP